MSADKTTVPDEATIADSSQIDAQAPQERPALPAGTVLGDVGPAAHQQESNPLPLKGTGQLPFTLKGAVNIQPAWGIGDDFVRIAFNYETPALHLFELPYIGRFDLSLEAGVSYWRATSGNHKHDEMAQITLLPLIRWWFWGPFFMEGGAGPSYFSETLFIEKDISSRFQFADQVGFGVQLTDAMRVSARFAHFSNAGIRRPNPGLNVCMVSISYVF